MEDARKFYDRIHGCRAYKGHSLSRQGVAMIVAHDAAIRKECADKLEEYIDGRLIALAGRLIEVAELRAIIERGE